MATCKGSARVFRIKHNFILFLVLVAHQHNAAAVEHRDKSLRNDAACHQFGTDSEATSCLIALFTNADILYFFRRKLTCFAFGATNQQQLLFLLQFQLRWVADTRILT
ncbi:hypothetical protein D3Y59_01315 [Hymenobacter oligotrophus]|uniref:Secreted protein n=1 Tax=Hymenobacter oligotrophus TaxID=2319843 RepID=A0A3B7QWV7_9BACT|nr:hypothetical protein D3Y59_01315 [Hymenobacter oligotrophus]